MLSIDFRKTNQLNETHRSPKIAYLPPIKGNKRGKVRNNISRPPAPFPVRTGRVIESFQGRLRKRHVDDQLHKLKVTIFPQQFPAAYYSLLTPNSNVPAYSPPTSTSADLKTKILGTPIQDGNTYRACAPGLAASN